MICILEAPLPVTTHPCKINMSAETFSVSFFLSKVKLMHQMNAGCA